MGILNEQLLPQRHVTDESAKGRFHQLRLAQKLLFPGAGEGKKKSGGGRRLQQRRKQKTQRGRVGTYPTRP